MTTKMKMVMTIAAGLALAACGDSGSDGGAGTSGGTGAGTGAGTAGTAAGGVGGTGAGAGAGGTAAGGVGGTGVGGATSTAGSGGAGGTGTSGTGGGGSLSTFEEAQAAIEAYALAHPGADGDVVAKTDAQLAADPDAQALRSICGADQAPVIPELAWEYGGSDHAWIGYESSALIYCVYTPVSPSTDHWQYDAAMDHVTADVYVLFPDDNPCKDEVGADQVAACIGDQTNFEILVDTASLDDGHGAGLELSESTTDLYLVLPDDTKVHLFYGG